MAHTLNLNDGTSHVIFSDHLDKRQDAFARILCETLGREAESMFWTLTLEKDNYTTFELKNAKETISNLEDIINDLRTDLDKRDAIIKELETKLHALETLIADLQTVLEHIPDMNGKPEEQMQQLQDMFDNTGSIIEKLKNII